MPGITFHLRNLLQDPSRRVFRQTEVCESEITAAAAGGAEISQYFTALSQLPPRRLMMFIVLS